MKSYQFVVMSNPVEGREEEYNRWYNEQHLPDLLKIPGVVAAQRFRVADDNGTHKSRYLALYRIESADVDAVMAEINARVGTDLMPMSDAIDMNGGTIALFEAIGPLMQAQAVN